MTEWSSQNRYARGARSKIRHSFDSTRNSRFMSWAPGAIDAERRAAQHELGVAEPQQVRQVGRAVGELQRLHLARQLGDAGPHVRLERRPVELLARSDRRELRRLGRTAHRPAAAVGHSWATWRSITSR